MSVISNSNSVDSSIVALGGRRKRMKNRKKRAAQNNYTPQKEKSYSKSYKKKKKKKEKKKSKKKGFWEEFESGLMNVLGIGAKLAQVIAPLFASRNGVKPIVRHCLGANKQSRRLGDDMIGTAYPLSYSGAPPPMMFQEGTRYHIIHRGLVGAVEVPASTAVGDQLLAVDLSPVSIEQWLHRMANFEKYRFDHIIISYHPACPSTTEGALVGYFEVDVDQPMNLGQGENTLKQVLAHYTAEMGSYWTPITWVLNYREGGWFYTDSSRGEKRLTTQGIFRLVAATDVESAFSAGQLEIAYDIVFDVPELQSQDMGTWCQYSGDMVGETTTAMFGGSIDVLDEQYRDPLDVDNVIPQNTHLRYCVVAGPLTSRFQCPRGYWSVAANFVGTVLGAAPVFTCYGAYEDTNHPYASDYGPTTATIYAGFYSSGMETAQAVTQLPENGFNITIASFTTLTSAHIRLTYLNGYPMYSFPVEMTSVLSRIMGRLNKAEKRLEKIADTDSEEEEIEIVATKKRRSVTPIT